MDATRTDLLSEGGLGEDLRGARLRATTPRLLVLGFLRQHQGRHCSAEEVTAALAGSGNALLRGSVYNVLSSLVAAGLVIVADAGPGRTLYEASRSWHHHFVCRACGGVSDVACVAGARPCLDTELPGALVDEAQVIFRGLCPACAPNGAGLPTAYPGGQRRS